MLQNRPEIRRQIILKNYQRKEGMHLIHEKKEAKRSRCRPLLGFLALTVLAGSLTAVPAVYAEEFEEVQPGAGYEESALDIVYEEDPDEAPVINFSEPQPPALAYQPPAAIPEPSAEESSVAVQPEAPAPHPAEQPAPKPMAEIEPYPDAWKVLQARRQDSTMEIRLSIACKSPKVIMTLSIPYWFRILNPRKQNVVMNGQTVAVLKRKGQDLLVMLNVAGKDLLQRGEALQLDLSLEALYPEENCYLNIGWDTVLYYPLENEAQKSGGDEAWKPKANETKLCEGISLEKNPFVYSTREETAAVLSGSPEEKIAALKQQFPAGKYWNHARKDQDYALESLSDHPCNHESESGTADWLCSVFDNGSQCAGFAFLCYYKFHGFKCNTDTLHSQKLPGNTVKVGDVLEEEGHYSFVSAVFEQDVEVIEANAGNPCEITQGRRVPRNEILGYYTPKTEYTIVYDSNGANGMMETQVMLCFGHQALLPNQFAREKEVFDGWMAMDGDGRCLYQSDADPQSFRFFHSRQIAARNGFSQKARFVDTAGVIGLAKPGESVTLQACWKEAD